VDLTMIDRDFRAGRDPQEIDHSRRGSERQRKKQRTDDEVRRKGGRDGRRRRPRRCRGVGYRGRPHVAEQFVERQPVDGREPGDRLVGPVLSAAVAQAVAFEHRTRRRIAAGHLADRHRGRHDAVGLCGGVRRLQVAHHVGEG
jgi:hypothetical protein